MILNNNYLQVCQCDICQAEDFNTCGGGKEFQASISPPGIITVSVDTEDQFFSIDDLGSTYCKTVAER